MTAEAEASPRSATLTGLTHLRALAIVMVFVFHYSLFKHPPWVERVGAFGWTGVDLFFVLSGFLISRQIFRSITATGMLSLRSFYLKRALRILPAYLAVLACYFCFPQVHERESLPPLWKFPTFTQNLGLDVRANGAFSHAWSLCIEEQFYLALPLVALAVMRPRVGRFASWLLPLVFALGFIVRGVVYRTSLPTQESDHFSSAWYEWIYYPTWSRVDGLLVGIAFAAISELRPKWCAPLWARGNSIFAVAVVLWFTVWWLFVEPDSLLASVVAFPAISIVYGVFLFAALSPSCFLARRSLWVSEWVATLSYALYLTHKICIHLVQQRLTRMGLPADGNSMLLVCVAGSLLAALALHLGVERPCLRWRDRLLDRMRRRKQ